MNLNKLCKMFRKYDKVIFDNLICNSDINLTISMFNSKKLMGLYIGYMKRDNKHGHIKISRCYTKKINVVKSTLIHEMVHCIQSINGLPVDHGKYFKKECKRINKHYGIDIS